MKCSLLFIVLAVASHFMVVSAFVRPGQVVLQVGDLALATQLKQWNPEGVVCVLPTMGLAKPVTAKLHTVRPDGTVAHSLTFELLPPRPQTPANQGPVAAEVNDR